MSAEEVRRYFRVIVQLPDYAIALTGCLFQTFSIDDFYRATGVLNEACPLQYSGGQANTRPSGSKHFSEKFVSHWQQIGTNSILAHEQPACETLINLV